RPAVKLQIDFGPAMGLKKSSAQITRNYRSETLVGRQVAAVVNFPPKQIGKFMSEVLVLGFPDSAGEVVLIQPTEAVPNGGRPYSLPPVGGISQKICLVLSMPRPESVEG